MKIRLIIAFLIIPLFCNVSWAADYGIIKFKAAFKSNNLSEIKSACSNLEWAGISDTQLYDIIEIKVLNRYKSDFNPALPYMIKSLGYSGQHKYRQTLDLIVKNGKDDYKSHAKEAIRNIFKYEKWNKIISNSSSTIKGLKQNEIRAVNLIKSDEYTLMRMGAKRIHFEHLYSEKVLDVLQKSIERHINSYSNDRYYHDAMAWMFKALGGSKNEKYVQTFIKTIDNSTDLSVARSANRFLAYYGISHTKELPKNPQKQDVSPEELRKTYDSEIAEEILQWN